MLKDKQYLADRLTARYGVRVSVGLHRRIEDVRDPKTGEIVNQIVHDDGEQFTRADGVAIAQADIDAETSNAEADEAAATDPATVAARDFDGARLIKALAVWAAQKFNVPLATARNEILTIYRGL